MRLIAHTSSMRLNMMTIWYIVIVLFLPPNICSQQDESRTLTHLCTDPNRECTLWLRDNNYSIDANDADFPLYAYKVAYINGTYQLVNSTRQSLPVTHNLLRINGPVVITGNYDLEYHDELNALESVEGPSTIRNNSKLLQIPISLFKVLCSHESSVCDVVKSIYVISDVYCRGDVLITPGYQTHFDPRCNILYGDLIVSGQEEGKNALSELLSNLHTVYGSVRIMYNQLSNFTFLGNLSTIEYSGDEACALEILANHELQNIALYKLRTIQLKYNTSNVYCILENKLKGGNDYQLKNNKKDEKIFLALMNDKLVRTDNITVHRNDQDVVETYFNWPNYLLAGTTVFFTTITIAVLVFWLSDYECRCFFYKFVPRLPKSKKKKGKKSKEAGDKSCYVGLVNGVSVEGGVEGYLNEYDFSNGAVYVTGPTNNNEAAPHRSCYLAGEAGKKVDATAEVAKNVPK